MDVASSKVDGRVDDGAGSSYLGGTGTGTISYMAKLNKGCIQHDYSHSFKLAEKSVNPEVQQTELRISRCYQPKILFPKVTNQQDKLVAADPHFPPCQSSRTKTPLHGPVDYFYWTVICLPVEFELVCRLRTLIVAGGTILAKPLFER